MDFFFHVAQSNPKLFWTWEFYQRKQNLDLSIPFPKKEIKCKLTKTWEYFWQSAKHQCYNNYKQTPLSNKREVYHLNSEAKNLALQMSVGIGQCTDFCICHWAFYCNVSQASTHPQKDCSWFSWGYRLQTGSCLKHWRKSISTPSGLLASPGRLSSRHAEVLAHAVITPAAPFC